jgi:hypothetical protein
MASYPTTVKTWTNVVDNIDDILAFHINDAFAEIIATEITLDSHLVDGVKHITSDERTTWNAKQAQLPNNLISDTTYQSAWQSFTMTYDPATGIFTTSVAHNFVLNDPIEFQANGGVLPIELLPYNSDNIGGTYYNIQSVADTTHFTITATVGGTLYMPTTTGSGAYQVRIAGLTYFDMTGLDLATDKMYKILLSNYGWARKISNLSAYLKLNNTAFSCFSGTAYGTTSYFFDGAVTKKYSVSEVQLELYYISAGTAQIYSRQKGSSSDDKSTVGTSVTADFGCLVKNITANITSIRFSSNNSANGLFRNGLNVQVWRMN